MSAEEIALSSARHHAAAVLRVAKGQGSTEDVALVLADRAWAHLSEAKMGELVRRSVAEGAVYAICLRAHLRTLLRVAGEDPAVARWANMLDEMVPWLQAQRDALGVVEPALPTYDRVSLQGRDGPKKPLFPRLTPRQQEQVG